MIYTQREYPTLRHKMNMRDYPILETHERVDTNESK